MIVFMFLSLWSLVLSGVLSQYLDLFQQLSQLQVAQLQMSGTWLLPLPPETGEQMIPNGLQQMAR